MFLTVFTINEFCRLIKSADTQALAELLTKHIELAQDSELMLNGVEQAIEADLGKSTHLGVIDELLKYPAVTTNIANEANKILCRAIVISPCIARRLMQLNAVANALQLDPNCAKLNLSLSLASFIDQKQIICEVADVVCAKTTTKNLPKAWHKAPTLLNVFGQRNSFKRQYKNYEHIADRVPADVSAIIFSFLPKTNLESEAITLEELRKIFPSRPQ